MKSITVNIDGYEYQLKGNDEESIKRSAEEVNSQIKEIRNKYKDDIPPLTVSVLASLNLAEIIEQQRLEFEEERKFLLDEIEKMGQFVNELLSENVNKQS